MRLSNIPILGAVLRGSRRLYDWMLGLADKPYAERALFGVSCAESIFFPIPPDPLLIAMGAGRPEKAIRFAGVTTFASVFGAIFGYAIGLLLMDSLGAWLLDLYDPDRHIWDKIVTWYDEHGVLALLIAAITPIPFKVFTIASGALGLPFLLFLGASAVGRSLRFFLEGFLLRSFGKPIVAWMDKWFDLAAISFAVLLVGGFVAIQYL